MKINNILSFLIIFFSIWLISCGKQDNPEIGTDPCSNNPCANSPIPHKTICEPDNDDFRCICENGYIEYNGGCIIQANDTPCAPENPCREEHKTTCIEGNNTYECLCDTGYYNNNGECIPATICEKTSCGEELHKTVCSIENNQIKCSCESGFTENQQGECIEIHDFNLRLMAANITSGNYQSYDPGDGIRIFKAVHPDVIMIQEMNYKDNSSSDYKELAGKIFNDIDCIEEHRCYYYAGTGQVPNGILSKYPIIKHGYWNDPNINNRDLNYAEIDLPGNKDLFVISVHLSTKGSKQVRPASIIAQNVAQHKIDNPDKYYYAVGGDFNGSSAVSTGGFGKENAFNINDAFPKSESGNYNTSSRRTKHYDWILVDSKLSNIQTSSDFCSESDITDCKRYHNGLVMDTREYTTDEIHTYFSPARLEDSEAIGMQHMAVIKDFKIIME